MSSSFMLRGAVSALGAPAGSCRRVRRGTSVAARAALSELKSTSVSLAKLSETGRVTKNVDGALLTLSYNSASKVVTVEDPAKGLRYPASVGKDNVVRFDADNGVALGMAPSGAMEALSLGTLSLGPELVNGRAAMLGLLGILLTEVASGRSAWQQIGSGSILTALVVAGAVSAASVAPLLTGAVSAEKLFPSELDPYADTQLPEVWTPTAERLNGRVAMAAFAIILVQELFKGGAVL